MTVPFDDFADLVRSRRTNLFVDPSRQVPNELVDQLCELATWAPNHKRTWPWRFAHLIGEARARLGDAFADDMVERDFGDEFKRTKTRTKYTRTPSILVVACAAHVKPTLHDENRDAVAAGIQNLLLGATARGIATFWSTPALNDSKRALEMCGFDPTDTIVAVIYLGWGTSNVATPDRPPVTVSHISA
ncbi:MAG TPA: nitroreductase [Ilumatobacter sp.]|nr:nitroreductase [Ilumatobacter sp.]